MLKKALLKDSIKEIKNSYKRFISIMIMALLGVGFFAGLRATSPDMIETIDTYFKDQNVYDIQVISTLGLTNEDIEALKNVEGVENVYGTYSQDGLIELEENEIVSKVMCVEDINKPKLVEGSLPQNINECVVEEAFLTGTNKKIGDTITIEIENQENSNGDEVEYLKQKELKIVGTVQSPLYISLDRGTSSLGSGEINYFIYVSKENVNIDFYTEIYIKVKDSEKYTTASSSYEKYIENVKNNIEEIKEEREEARYQSLITQANNKIAEAEQEFNTQKQDGESKIIQAEQELQSARDEITKGENELSVNEQKANSEFSQAEKKLESAKAELLRNITEYNNRKQEAEQGFSIAETQKQELETNLNSINAGLEEINVNYAQIIEKLNDPNLTEEQKMILEQSKNLLENQRNQLESNKQSVEAGITEINNQITTGRQELANAEALIESARTEIPKQEANLESEKAKANRELANARSQLEQAKTQLQEGEAELEKSKTEFNQKIEEAEAKLIDAREKVNEIENPEWYILDRNENTGYRSFKQDTESIENLSLVFPIVFFAIAALVSLTSMTRMVEEQRQELGTLKALGYNKFQISIKYILYSSLACIIGSLIGMNIGFQLLPRLIWEMYSIMYIMPDIIIEFNHAYSSLGLGLIYVCIVGATIYAILRELVNQPATLLRPKAPKLGKRVLLERITPIWKRLNFSQKVTVRNIFRYKKRFLMTIIGIFGCTSLILAGFGLKDSISKILPYQYEKIFDYNMQVTLKSSLENEQIQNLITNIKSDDRITDVIETDMLSGVAKKDNNEKDIQIVIPNNNDEVNKCINLIDNETEENIELNNEGVYITDKLAELLNVSEGDTITIETTNDETKEFKVTKTVENYVSHYVYITKDLYNENFETDYSTNVLLLKDNNLSDEEQQELSREMLQQNEISTITSTSTVMKSLDDTMNSLNYVVLILIVSAGLLAFVVLYNLSNVNISERIRELATIKVLGFYDKEVYKYVSRETMLLTAIGILLGLAGGYFLNFYIIGTCEIEMLRFPKTIDFISYIYSIAITLIFTLIVNVVTYFALKKIDMIGSLKSVE